MAVAIAALVGVDVGGGVGEEVDVGRGEGAKVVNGVELLAALVDSTDG